jgi:signal transduction histidine kinase
MSDREQGGHGWSRRPDPNGPRPRWWPEGEAWPPTSDAPWRRARQRFMWRFGCFFLIFIGFVGTLVALVAWLVGRVLDGSVALVVSAVLPFVVLVVFLAIIARLLRGAGAPVGDLIEAAGRVEAGEVGTQVAVRGPAEVRSLARAFNAMTSRLEQTDEARRRLLADVSHELRTPLTVMQGNLEGMLDGLYPIDEEHLAPVLEETRVLARLVEDLRTLSLSEAGSLRLHREPTDLGRLLEEVAAGHRIAADAAGVTLTVRAAPDLPLLDVDPARMRQVIVNLVANALRFTPSGGEITLGASKADDGIGLTVRDTGAGMEPDAVEHAFDRFYRSPDSSGTGLGLPIARNLVEAHGGRIELHSTPGEGTTVEVTLPPAPS